MPIQKTRDQILTEAVISKHECLISIRDYLELHNFKYPEKDFIPQWFSDIKLILAQADYKF